MAKFVPATARDDDEAPSSCCYVTHSQTPLSIASHRHDDVMLAVVGGKPGISLHPERHNKYQNLSKANFSRKRERKFQSRSENSSSGIAEIFGWRDGKVDFVLIGGAREMADFF